MGNAYGSAAVIRDEQRGYQLRVREDGSLAITLETDLSDSGSTKKLALDDTSTTGFLYIGLATIGAATSAAVWRIFKMPISTLGVTLAADGDDSYDNVWDSRASLSYS